MAKAEKLHEENMWCFHCEKEWVTKDYFNCRECPYCTTQPVRMHRTSSFAFIYAYYEKHPEERPKQQNKNQ